MSENTCKDFRPIPGYEKLYKVSSVGDIFSIRRNRILKPKHSKQGYLRVTLCDSEHNHKTIGVHRLVALTFIPNPLNKPTVNHINENKLDNRVENLEWATTAEQNAHGTRTQRAMRNTDWGKRTMKIDYATVAQKHNYQSPLMCNRKKTIVHKDGVALGVFDSQRSAAKYTKVSTSKVSACVNGLIKSSHGFVFSTYWSDESGEV